MDMTIIGKAWEPATRFTNTGKAITEVNVSVYDGKDQDQKAKYYNVTVKCFNELAEEAGNGIQKGDNVIAIGRLTIDKWEKDGQKHSKIVLLANDIGISLRQFGKKAEPFGGEVVPDSEFPF